MSKAPDSPPEGPRLRLLELSQERGASLASLSEMLGRNASYLQQFIRKASIIKGHERSPAEEAVLRDRVAQLYIESELLRLTGIRGQVTRRSNEPGPEGSVGKLAQADIMKAIWQCCSDVIGPDALVYEHGYKLRQGRTTASDSKLQAKYNLLRSRAYSIEGGTSEIMRNILGERVLGLPGEPRVDKNIPWKEVPRS